jgi:hypothetical protein
MNRLKVLVLPPPLELLNSKRQKLDEYCSAHHDLRLLDRAGDVSAQMRGIDAIVDYGGQRESL